jgi:hypothetical protein
MDRTDKVFVFLVLIGVAAAVFLAVGRARIERANHTVEIVIDADDARRVATSAGTTLPLFLAELRQAGAGAVAVRELTVGDLADQGRLMAMALGDESNLITPDSGLAGLLAPALAARLPQIEITVGAPPPVIILRLPAGQATDIPVLLPMEEVAAAEAAGLGLVARLRSFPGATPAAVRAAVEAAAAAGARLVIFDKEEILGYDGLLGITADAMREHDLLFGRVEMAGQRGDGTLAQSLFDRTVRVHSISESDMLTMVPAIAVPRYGRAVEERNIRVVYVRLITRGLADPAAYNADYVQAIARELRRRGFSLGKAEPFSAPAGWPSRWPRGLVVLATLAGAILLLRRLVPVSQAWAWVVFLVSLIAGLGVGALRPQLVTPAGGLVGALAFPTLATVWAVQGVRGRYFRVGLLLLLRAAVWRLLGACVISLAGAMLVVGLYSRVGYLSGLVLFTGVKLSFVFPLVLVLAAGVADVSAEPGSLSLWWVRTRTRLQEFVRQPVNVLQLAVVIAAIAALGFTLTRTGNQPIVSPSAFEVKMRGALESILVVRPRTKEFLLGHPALMLAVVLALRRRRAWLPLVATAAAIGQVSLLNTYCHFHTPLHISLLRTLNGFWLGAVSGALLLLVWAVARRCWARPT